MRAVPADEWVGTRAAEVDDELVLEEGRDDTAAVEAGDPDPDAAGGAVEGGATERLNHR